MISVEDVMKWGAIATTVSGALVTGVLFVSYRADYIRAGHPEPTLLAVRLTKSTLMDWARFRRGEKRRIPQHHSRRGDDAPHGHLRKEDMGTVNRPIEGLDEILQRRRTPPSRRSHDVDAE